MDKEMPKQEMKQLLFELRLFHHDILGGSAFMERVKKEKAFSKNTGQEKRQAGSTAANRRRQRRRQLQQGGQGGVVVCFCCC